METILSQKMRKLWENPSTHRFFTELSRMTKVHSLKDIVFEGSQLIASRCEDNTSIQIRSLLGLESAWGLTSFFYTKNKLLPLVQMLWYGISEAKSKEMDIKEFLGIPPAASELNIENFKRSFINKDFQKTYQLMIFLMRDPKIRPEILSFLIAKTMTDEAQGGEKFIAVVKAWQFCEAMNWQNYHSFWYPALNLIFNTFSQETMFSPLEDFIKQHSVSESGHKLLSQKQEEELKHSLFNDEKTATLEKCISWLKEGYSISALFEGMKLAAADLVYLSPSTNWFITTQTNFYIKALTDILDHLSPQLRFKALVMATLIIKKTAILIKPFHKLPEAYAFKTIDERNNALFFLEYAIEKGEVSKSLGALQCLMDQKKIDTPVMFDTLAFLASKNTHSVFYGHDIHYALTALKNYKNSQSSSKDLYLLSLVKLLTEQPKEHTIYNALMNTQKIRLGYYAAQGNGDFPF